MLSATLPMTFYEVPAIPLMNPVVRDPVLVRMRPLPVTGYPHVLTAFPAPVSRRPNEPALGGRSVCLHSYGWGRHHDRRARIVVAWWWRGSHDASAE
jgi:hypothetical protein